MGWLDKTTTKKTPYISPSERRRLAEEEKLAALPSVVADGTMTIEEFNILHEEAIKHDELLKDWKLALSTNQDFDEWELRKIDFEEMFGHFIVGDKFNYFGFTAYITDIREPVFNPATETVYTHRIYRNYTFEDEYETKYHVSWKDYKVSIQYRDAKDNIRSVDLNYNECFILE